MSPAYRNALLLLHFTVFLWGWTGIFGKLIEQETAQLVFTRTFIALSGLAVFALATRHSLDWRTPDLKHWRLYGVEKASQYPTLEPMIAGRINVELIRVNWEEILRIVVSIRTGTVTA